MVCIVFVIVTISIPGGRSAPAARSAALTQSVSMTTVPSRSPAGSKVSFTRECPSARATAHGPAAEPETHATRASSRHRHRPQAPGGRVTKTHGEPTTKGVPSEVTAAGATTPTVTPGPKPAVDHVTDASHGVDQAHGPGRSSCAGNRYRAQRCSLTPEVVVPDTVEDLGLDSTRRWVGHQKPRSSNSVWSGRSAHHPAHLAGVVVQNEVSHSQDGVTAALERDPRDAASALSRATTSSSENGLVT